MYIVNGSLILLREKLCQILPIRKGNFKKEVGAKRGTHCIGRCVDEVDPNTLLYMYIYPKYFFVRIKENVILLLRSCLENV